MITKKSFTKNMADDDDPKEYRWESGYEKTWETIQEDDEGLVEASIESIINRAKRKRLLEKEARVRLGMMRHLYLVIDLSEAMQDLDLKPTRQICTVKLLEGFVEDYFDQNPISQLGIITTQNKRAERISELAGNSRRHISCLEKLKEVSCSGEPSLQNSLELALQTLKHLPGHVSREVVIIFGSLTTCDPGDINQTIQTLKLQKIRCSVVGLAAEVRICKSLCKETGGTYSVILDDNHFKELLHQFISPPPASEDTESSLIRMGFPHRLTEEAKEGSQVTLCICHLDAKPQAAGYYCPQCRAKYCELPVECRVCNLTLVSAPLLARSYHHLFPLEMSTELPRDQTEATICFACRSTLKQNSVAQCKTCKNIFCTDCDFYVHETLHTCPGCSVRPAMMDQSTV